jgi:hypothetical protein
MSTHTISQVLAWVTQCREIKEAMQVACSPEWGQGPGRSGRDGPAVPISGSSGDGWREGWPEPERSSQERDPTWKLFLQLLEEKNTPPHSHLAPVTCQNLLGVQGQCGLWGQPIWGIEQDQGELWRQNENYPPTVPFTLHPCPMEDVSSAPRAHMSISLQWPCDNWSVHLPEVPSGYKGGRWAAGTGWRKQSTEVCYHSAYFPYYGPSPPRQHLF